MGIRWVSPDRALRGPTNGPGGGTLRRAGSATGRPPRRGDEDYEDPRELLLDDCVLPLPPPTGRNLGEHELAAAVLRRAWLDAFGPHPDLRHEARVWICSPGGNIYSFEFICSVFELDASAIRAKLRPRARQPHVRAIERRGVA